MRGSGELVRVLVVAVLLLMGASATVVVGAMNHPVTPVNQLGVIDGRGKLVGSQIGSSGDTALVFIKVGTTILGFAVYPTHLAPGANTVGTPLVFESSDCTGQPLTADYAPTVYGPQLVLAGTKVYAPIGPAQAIASNSYLKEDGTCQQEAIYPQALVPIAAFFDWTTEFVPPFSVR